MASLADLAQARRDIREMLEDGSIPNTEVAEASGFSEAAVRRWRKANSVSLESRDEVEDLHTGAPEGTPQATIKGDSGFIYTGPLPEPITDETGWAPLLKMLGIGDPENWTVVDDSVKVSTWQQSKRTESGDRDVVLLYAYSARIRRTSAEELLAADELDAAAALVKAKRHTYKRPKSIGQPVFFVWQQGDEQAGKGEGGGLEGLWEREDEALRKGFERLDWLISKGVNVVGILDSAQGDRMENIFGHYPSQARTTATFRKQVGYAVDMDVARTEMWARFGLPLLKAYTPSNHGEIRQVIGQSPYTSESDNLDLMIAELVRQVIDRVPEAADLVEWYIPHDQWLTEVSVLLDADTWVNVGVTHGHKADGKGQLQKWIKDQIHYFERHRSFSMDLMLLGHRHHFYAEQIHGTTIIQTPSLDGGSPYFEAGYGEKADHGVVSFVIDATKPLKFDHLTIV